MLSMFQAINKKFCLQMNLLTFVTACFISSLSVAAEPTAAYSSIPGVDCVINPYKVADLASPVAGVIDDLYVERSQIVSAGQVVAQLDADVERASVNLARYRADIQSEIKLGQVNMEFDKRRKIRIDLLHEKQVTSIEHIEEAEREEGLSKWKLEQARELAVIRKLELKRAQQQLSQKSIRAPFDGYVLDTFKNRGEYVEDQSILRLAQLDPLVVEAIVPMENFGVIKVGMTAEILPEYKTDEKLTGTVSIVDRIGDTASNTFGVRLILPNPENHVPAGLKCIVKFIQPTGDNELARLARNQVMTEKMIVEELKAQQNPALSGKKQAGIDHDGNDQIIMHQASSQQTGAVQLIQRNTADVPASSPLQDKELSMNKLPSGYMVMTEQGDTGPHTREIINRLRQAGIDDLQEIDHGIYKGLISLGLYSIKNSAEKRQQLLAELGFSSFISARY